MPGQREHEKEEETRERTKGVGRGMRKEGGLHDGGRGDGEEGLGERGRRTYRKKAAEKPCPNGDLICGFSTARKVPVKTAHVSITVYLCRGAATAAVAAYVAAASAVANAERESKEKTPRRCDDGERCR